MAVILACPDRVCVGYVPEEERRRFGQNEGGERTGRAAIRKPIDRAGPTLLLLLLCSSFVPALLTEFDGARLLRILQAAIVAIGQSSQSFVSGEQRPLQSPADLACSSGGCQVADSAAVIFDGRAVAVEMGSNSSRGRNPAFRKKRLRSPRSPRAPPPSLSLPPVPGRD